MSKLALISQLRSRIEFQSNYFAQLGPDELHQQNGRIAPLDACNTILIFKTFHVYLLLNNGVLPKYS